MAITRMPDSLPTTVYHPVHGARQITDFNDIGKLGPDWFPTAEEADMHRTWTEAKVTMHHNQAVKASVATGNGVPEGPAPGDASAPQGVVRNSVAAQESLDAGNAEPL